MPALPRVHLKTSNTHNFWTVVPEIMKFALTWSLFRDASSQKVSKNLKIVWDHTTQPRTDLSPVGTSGSLGVKVHSSCYLYRTSRPRRLQRKGFTSYCNDIRRPVFRVCTSVRTYFKTKVKQQEFHSIISCQCLHPPTPHSRHRYLDYLVDRTKPKSSHAYHNSRERTGFEAVFANVWSSRPLFINFTINLSSQ
jgi:hypothetical protein